MPDPQDGCSGTSMTMKPREVVWRPWRLALIGVGSVVAAAVAGLAVRATGKPVSPTLVFWMVVLGGVAYFVSQIRVVEQDDADEETAAEAARRAGSTSEGAYPR